MFESIKKFKVTTIIACGLSLINVLGYFSMRCIWTGIGKVLNGNQVIPNLLMIIFFITMVATFTLAILHLERWPMYLLLGLNGIFLIALGVIIKQGAWDYLRFIGREFLQASLVTVICIFIIWVIFFYPKSKLAREKYILMGLMSALILGIIYTQLGLGINKITQMPVVYAVEDEYQIVFSSRLDSTAWLEINGVKYYDTYAGSLKSETKIHKVSVPMDALDTAGSYTVYVKAMLMRGPYGSFEGSIKSYQSAFRAVDTSDGFDYYAISDVHGSAKAGINCATYLGDKLDLLVMIGDINSILEEEADILLINDIAYGVTKGEVPVVYARGNHEVKGTVADELYKYVGSVNEKFYFTFQLRDVWGVVLDTGEDHDDDWWEYYDTAQFSDYRNEQLAFLADLIASKPYDDPQIKYRMAISHFPLTFVEEDEFLKDFKQSCTTCFNEMQIDIHLAGHFHQLIPVIPGLHTPFAMLSYNNLEFTQKTKEAGYYTDSAFPTFVISKRDSEQYDDNFQNQLGSKMIGVSVHCSSDFSKSNLCYTNQSHELVHIVDPFSSHDFGEVIQIK